MTPTERNLAEGNERLDQVLHTPIADTIEIRGAMNSDELAIIAGKLSDASPDYQRTMAMNGGSGFIGSIKMPHAGLIEAGKFEGSGSWQYRMAKEIEARYNAHDDLVALIHEARGAVFCMLEKGDKWDKKRNKRILDKLDAQIEALAKARSNS